jgi:hypothetical protein
MIKISLSSSVAKKLGLLMIVVGLIWSGFTASFLMRATKVSGEIVQIHRVSRTKDRIRYYPIFHFKDASGKSWTNRSSVSYSVYEFNPGSKVDILYNSSQPSEAQLASLSGLWTKPLIVTAFGLLLILVSPFVEKRTRLAAT